MDRLLVFTDVPHHWPICYQHDCPLANTCLRHHAAMEAPADLKHHECVLPGAYADDTRPCFVEDKPIRMARGMTKMLPTDEPWKDTALRQNLEVIFGCHAQYYRYRAGRFLITPAQQKRVAALFRKFGIAKEPQYDHMEERYYFPKQMKAYHQ